MTLYLSNALCLIAALLFSPGLAEAELQVAKGPHSHLHAVEERTLFKTDHYAVDLQVGEKARKSLMELVQNIDAEAESLADQVSSIVHNAEDLRMAITFFRGFDYEKLLGELRSRAACAHETGSIDADQLEQLVNQSRGWFAPLEFRGAKKGDQLILEIDDSRMRLQFIPFRERALVDRRLRGSLWRDGVVLAFFAPCSNLREKLAQSIFDEQ